MKIAIDVSPLKSTHRYRGVGFYTRRLVKALKKVDKENQYIFIQHPASSIDHPDLIHYPYFDLFFLTLPIRKIVPTVVTIHDVIPLIFPDKFPKGLRGWLKFQIQKFSLRSVKAVITDSKNSKGDIVRYLEFPKEKIHVVPLAPGEEFRKLEAGSWKLEVRRKYKLPEKFVLYVGDVNWNKNVPVLVRACKQAKVALVLVGKAFENENLPETKAILQLIKQLSLNKQTRILGYVLTKDLVAIYNLATVYCQPSFYEGFCLPVLEAMACGTPVVTSKLSSLPEVVGEAAIFIDPDSPSDIAKGIKRIIEDKKLAATLRERGFRQASKFSWERTARETIRIYRKVLENEV